MVDRDQQPDRAQEVLEQEVSIPQESDSPFSRQLDDAEKSLKNSLTKDLDEIRSEQSDLSNGLFGDLVKDIGAQEAKGSVLAGALELAEVRLAPELKSLNGVVGKLANMFSPELSKQQQSLTEELRKAFVFGNVLTSIEVDGAKVGDTKERFEEAMHDFIELAHDSAIGGAFAVAGKVATGTALLDKAVMSGSAGELVAKLGEFGRSGFEQLSSLGLNDFEQKSAIRLARYATSAGMELSADGVKAGLTPGLKLLVREALTHAKSAEGYYEILESAFAGADRTEIQAWLPGGGEQFARVNRERARIGNPPIGVA